jgi:hypothetical protein
MMIEDRTVMGRLRYNMIEPLLIHDPLSMITLMPLHTYRVNIRWSFVMK